MAKPIFGIILFFMLCEFSVKIWIIWKNIEQKIAKRNPNSLLYLGFFFCYERCFYWTLT